MEFDQTSRKNKGQSKKVQYTKTITLPKINTDSLPFVTFSTYFACLVHKLELLDGCLPA